MSAFGGLTAYDLVVLGLAGVLIARGIYLGMLKQVTGLLALYFGYFAASQYHDRIFPFLRDISTNPKVGFLATYVMLFVVTYLVIMLLGKVLGRVISVSIVGWFDKILGGVIGFAKAVLLVVVLHMILGTLLAPENQMLRTCMSCDLLNDGADIGREVIKNEDVRKALKQQQPAIALDAVKNIISTPVAQSKTDEAKAKESKH